jgi:hypothetical protein
VLFTSKGTAVCFFCQIFTVLVPGLVGWWFVCSHPLSFSNYLIFSPEHNVLQVSGCILVLFFQMFIYCSSLFLFTYLCMPRGLLLGVPSVSQWQVSCHLKKYNDGQPHWLNITRVHVTTFESVKGGSGHLSGYAQWKVPYQKFTIYLRTSWAFTIIAVLDFDGWFLFDFSLGGVWGRGGIWGNMEKSECQISVWIYFASNRSH